MDSAKWGSLAVGSLAVGSLAVGSLAGGVTRYVLDGLAAERFLLGPQARTLLMIGFCGAYSI